MARKRATLTDLLNDLTFKTLYEKYKLIAINAFEWTGLPEGIEERHIERELFDEGKAIFFKDPRMSFMCLKAQKGYGMNVYGEPTTYRAIGLNYNEEYNADDCVIIENNKLRLDTRSFVLHYVNKLTEAERTLDVNIKACKTPIVFTCDDKDLLSFKRMFQEVDGNAPALFVARGLNPDSIQSFQTGAKLMALELSDYIQTVENKLLTFLGINNPAVDKRERLITDEVNANDQLIESFAELQLEARQRACEAINKLYGLNVSVKRREAAADVVSDNVRNNEDDNRIA